jgi:hypothetical protein
VICTPPCTGTRPSRSANQGDPLQNSYRYTKRILSCPRKNRPVRRTSPVQRRANFQRAKSQKTDVFQGGSSATLSFPPYNVSSVSSKLTRLKALEPLPPFPSIARTSGGQRPRTSGANGGSSVVRRSNSNPPRNVRSYRGSLTNVLDSRLTRRIPR